VPKLSEIRICALMGKTTLGVKYKRINSVSRETICAHPASHTFPLATPAFASGH